MLTTSSNFSIGQQFVNSSNEWFADDCCYAQGQFHCSTFKYWFEETVIIDSITYFKLNSNNLEPMFELGEYYREENGVVFLKPNETQEEIAIYNFNLNVGEQFEIGNSAQQLLIEVLSVDSITLNSGEKRKRLEIARASNTNIKTYWIEGIGSELSPLNPLWMFVLDCWNELNCFHKENIVEFQLGNCELTSIENINESKRTINCYPNPSSEEINLSSDSGEEIRQIEIIDLHGNSILQIITKTLEPIKLDRISDGIYLIRITFKDGSIGITKFVKNKN